MEVPLFQHFRQVTLPSLPTSYFFPHQFSTISPPTSPHFPPIFSHPHQHPPPLRKHGPLRHAPLADTAPQLHVFSGPSPPLCLPFRRQTGLSSIHPCIHPSIHASIHSSMHPCIHPCIHASMHPSMHPCIHASDRTEPRSRHACRRLGPGGRGEDE